MLNEKTVLNNINKRSSYFNKSSFFYQEIGNRLIDRLQICKLRPDTILDLGCKTGYMSTLLHKKYPDAEIYSLELSNEMLGKFKVNTNQKLNRKLCTSYTNLPFANDSFDLVVSNLQLHWNNDFQIVLNACQRVLSKHGLLMFSALGMQSFTELRAAWSAIDSHVHVHDFLDFIELGSYLLKTQWCDPVVDKENITIKYNKILDLYQDLKSLGATNSHVKRNKGLTTKRTMQRVSIKYKALFEDNETIPVTCEVIYGHAIKKQAVNQEISTEIKEIFIPIKKLFKKNDSD